MSRTLTQEEIASELAKMENVMKWPQMHLPVKNLHDEPFERRLGVILHTTNHLYDVFECNQFLMKDAVIIPLQNGREPECPVHHYNSFREVVEDGWVGD
jgi:hypothetical protein